MGNARAPLLEISKSSLTLWASLHVDCLMGRAETEPPISKYRVEEVSRNLLKLSGYIPYFQTNELHAPDHLNPTEQ